MDMLLLKDQETVGQISSYLEKLIECETVGQEIPQCLM
jgi:hypothetical protein